MGHNPGPPTWATQEQTELLQLYLPDYSAISYGDRHYTNFWANLKEVWFSKYSVHTELYPNRPVKDLSIEERQNVTSAMDKALAVCQCSICLCGLKLTHILLAPQELVPLENQS